jgi:hypothetical protein
MAEAIKTYDGLPAIRRVDIPGMLSDGGGCRRRSALDGPVQEDRPDSLQTLPGVGSGVRFYRL